MSKAKAKQVEKPEAEPKAAGLGEREASHYREIRGLEERCAALESAAEAAKDEAAAAKAAWMAAVAKLRDCIRSGPDAQLRLPIAEGSGGGVMERPIAEALTLNAKQAEALEAAGIATVEDFEALRAGRISGYPFGLSSLPGVGSATAERWEDEVLDFLGKHRAAEGGAE